jgi:hypothetical protein
MEKPTVFFSHSSKDKVYIQELKKIVDEQTSGTIEVFQSSDGESIPFGRNWIHKVEENLNNAKIMFVFISPNSLTSNWIYFESGYSYSKKIKVIPIGILGVDIGKLNAPMSLLQGFNITSNEGLNNIIAILNNEFSCKYKTDISDSVYYKLQNKTSLNEIIDDNLYNQIDHIETKITKIVDNGIVPNPFEVLKKYLDDNSIEYRVTLNEVINLYGMEVKETIDKDSRVSQKTLNLKIDLLGLQENLEIIAGLLPLIYEKIRDIFWLSIHFNKEIKLITTNFKLSAHLKEFNINMSDISGDIYIYKDILFALDEVEDNINKKETYQSLRIIYNPTAPNVKTIIELIKFLFSIKVIYKI